MELTDCPIPTHIQVVTNPYPHTIPDAEFNLLIGTLARRLAAQIASDYSLEKGLFGHLENAGLGICLMNPTLPRYTPAREAVMALIAIGEKGQACLVNGVGKAITHWEMGENCGIGAYVNLHRLPDGAFVYGHSAEVDGTIVGASAASEQQDRGMGVKVAGEYNMLVCDAREAWKSAHPEYKWFCNDNLPREVFTEVAGWLHEPIRLGAPA